MSAPSTAKIGAGATLGEGMDLATEPIPTSPEEVDAFWCLRFLRAIRDCAFATIDADGMPGVRIVDVMAVEPGRLFFLAPRGKSFHDDLVRTGTAALVGQTPDLRMCRLRGRVAHPDDPDEQRRLIDMMFELNPSMEVLYPGEARRICDAFYIEEGEGEYYDLGQRPLLRAPFALSDTEDLLSGCFVIDGSCIGCGRCAEACPAECIESGTPFRIRQEHCLRCGRCVEACPAHAIAKTRRTVHER